MAKKKKQLKAVIYARKSFDDKEESEAISTQLKHCRQLAKREGYNVIDEFHEAQSGRTPPAGYEHIFKHDTVTLKAIRKQRSKDRPLFGKLCKMIEAGEVDVVILRDTTRLARPKAMSTLINWIPQLLKQHKVDIHSVQEGYLRHDDENRLMYQIILDSMVDRELSKRAESSAKVRRENKEAGIYEGKPYYGVSYKKRSKKYKVNPEEAKAVKLAFKLRVKGKSFADIVKQLADDGVKRWDGKFFTGIQISILIQKPMYAGLLNLGNKDNPDFIEAKNIPKIVTKNQFFKCWELYEANKKIFNGNQNRGHSGALLSGLIFCKSCGCLMGKNTAGGKRLSHRDKKTLMRYMCSSARHSQNLNCKDKGNINGYKLEEFIKPFTMLEIVSKNFEAEENQEKRKDLPKLIKQEQELRERRSEIIKDSSLSIDFIKEAGQQLSEEISDLQKQIHKLEVLSIPNKSKVKNIVDYSKLTMEEQRGILRKYIKRIEVSRKTVEITLYSDAVISFERIWYKKGRASKMPKIDYFTTTKMLRLEVEGDADKDLYRDDRLHVMMITAQDDVEWQYK